MGSLNNTCVSCECNKTLSATNLCEGVLCDGDYECRSGRCYLGFCAKNTSTTDTCMSEEDAPCSKCANVGCNNDFECQTGECSDDTHLCYDPIFWIVVLCSTIGSVLLIVGLLTCCLVRKRRVQRLNESLREGSEHQTQASEHLLNNTTQPLESKQGKDGKKGGLKY